MQFILKFISILILLTFIPSAYINAQWQQTGFPGKHISDVVECDGKIIIPVRVGTYGITNFYASTDLGTSWDSLGFLNTPWVNNLECAESNLFITRFWACAGFCDPAPCIFRSNSNWTNTDILFSAQYGASNLLEHGNIIFASLGSTIIKTVNAGLSWDTVKSVPENISFLLSTDNALYLTSSHFNDLYISEDNGENWTLINDKLPFSFYSLAENNNFLFAGSTTGIYRSSDKGKTWVVTNSVLSSVNIIKTNGEMIFAWGYNSEYKSKILYSSDNGEKWLDISQGLELPKHDRIHSIQITSNYIIAATDDGVWKFNLSTLTDVKKEIAALNYELYQNYPNPFNPETKIKYTLAASGYVDLKVYDVLGNEIETLVNKELPAGEYTAGFNAAGLPSGIYFYILNSGGTKISRKIILLK